MDSHMHQSHVGGGRNLIWNTVLGINAVSVCLFLCVCVVVGLLVCCIVVSVLKECSTLLFKGPSCMTDSGLYRQHSLCHFNVCQLFSQ